MSEKTEMVKLTKAKYCFSFFFFLVHITWGLATHNHISY